MSDFGSVIDRPNLHELVGEDIKRQIFDGVLKPGDKIGEDDIARKMGTSRTPVKLALTELAKEGLVELVPRRGAFVRRFTHTDIIELYEIRHAIEGMAGRLAARHIDEKRIEYLEEMNELYAEAVDTLAGDPDNETNRRHIKKLDMIFHRTILESTRNRHLEMMIGLKSIEFMSFLYIEPTNPVATCIRVKREHDEIISALKSGDERNAEKKLQQHIEMAIESLRQQRRKDQVGEDQVGEETGGEG